MESMHGPSGRPVVDVIEEGVDLYSSDDEKIGHVDEINPEFFIVSSGFLGRKQLYLPRSAEERRDGDRIYLNLSKDEIEDGEWSEGASGQWAYDETPYEGPRPGTRASDESGPATQRTRIRRYEEELAPEKRVDERQVQIGKRVTTEQQTIDVPVQREELRIRTRPVAGDVDDENAFGGDEVTIPLREEKVEVTKRPRAVEEVEVEKVGRQETQRVSDTVRKEQFDLPDEEINR